MNPRFEDISFDAVIPSAILFNKNIEPSAIKLYAFVRGLTRAHGYCYATNKYLSECMECDERTVTRLLKSLSDEGFIEIETYKEGLHCQRHIFIGVCLKESLRKDKNVYPPGQKCPPPPTNLSTNKRYKIEDIEKEGCLSPPPVGPEEVPKSIKKFDTSGSEISFDLDELFRKAVQKRKDWKIDEIMEAWNILLKYSGRVNDYMAFIEGTIKNVRKKSNLNRIPEEKCQNKKSSIQHAGLAPKPMTPEKLEELKKGQELAMKLFGPDSPHRIVR